MAALKYWLWLTSKKEISNTTALKLVEYFKSPENVFFSFGEGCTELCLKENEKAALLDKSMFKASAIMEQCDNLGVGIITVSDSAYPERLKNIYDPPAVLYVKGKLTQIDDEAVIAMVGTRKASAYGLAASERIAFETVKCGGIVATGLAEGIDTAAAKGALKGGGKVLGVLGNGIDVVYPYFNKQLYRDVVSSGALISEFAPGTRPLAGNFPRRNRIISGLSVGVAVVESPKHGGSLITAARALEQGRDLFAVP